jgi:hypothetical protein
MYIFFASIVLVKIRTSNDTVIYHRINLSFLTQLYEFLYCSTVELSHLI